MFKFRNKLFIFSFEHEIFLIFHGLANPGTQINCTTKLSLVVGAHSTQNIHLLNLSVHNQVSYKPY